MKKEHEKMMLDLQRFIDKQEFTSEEELQLFLKSLTGKKIPTLPNEELTPKEQAQDLIFAAHELTPAKAKANVKKALALDPDCIEAYEYLGLKERTLELAITSYEKAIAIGRRIFGGEYLEENKGMFWGLHETRPFMRCLYHYADCLYIMNKVEECVTILEEMIELNPNDNQGIRDQLILYLIQLGENKKYLKYAKMFKGDCSTFSLYNRALFTFKTEGASAKAAKQLKKAIKENKYVPKQLLSNKPVKELASYYSMGDGNESDYYVSFAQPIWAATEGAMEWLKKCTENA